MGTSPSTPLQGNRPVCRAGRRSALASGMRPPRPAFALALVLVALAACTERPVSGTSTAGPYVPAPGEATVFPDLRDGELLAALRAEYAPQRTLGYGPARDALFAYEMATDGHLEGVYTGYTVVLPPGLDPSAAAADLGVNTEHVWPQSYGAGEEPLRSDMHHLFPARQNVNSSRGNLPFGEIADDETEAWYRLDQSQSNTPTVAIDEWSERGAGRFEPREGREGDVARAVFYVAALYPAQAGGAAAFFDGMRGDLLAWNRDDPPDDAERALNAWIATEQGTENPFVLDPTLADRAFGAGLPAAPPRPPGAVADLAVVEVHYDNDGGDVGEGVEVAGPPGTALAGWSLALYNGSDGRVYRTVPLAGALSAGGVAWTPIDGLQNGSPDGIALVAPGGEVRQFLSYEGTLTAEDGPAAGRRSQDLGVQETASDAPGRSLQLVSGSWTVAPATPGRPNR